MITFLITPDHGPTVTVGSEGAHDVPFSYMFQRALECESVIDGGGSIAVEGFPSSIRRYQRVTSGGVVGVCL